MICDLAETYHIYDYRELPIQTLATLVSGLRANSRVKMAINGAEVPTDTLLLAMIYDKLNVWVWRQTKEGSKGHNPPELLAPKMAQKSTQKKNNVEAFETGEDFDNMRKKIIGGN